MLPRVLSVFLLACGLALGQAAANSNSVTVTASRSTNVQPDQAVFNVQVGTPVTAMLTDAVNALQGSGITAANLSQVTTVQEYDPNGQVSRTDLAWYFSLTVAIADMKSTIGLLSAVQKSVGSQNNGISISFGVAGTSVSPQTQEAQQCAQSDLLSDAKAQAQKLAGAAGKGVGAVLAMSGSTTASTQTSGLINSGIVTPGCTVTVKFQLTGF